MMLRKLLKACSYFARPRRFGPRATSMCPNLFDDLSPIQQETVAQDRTLTNAGLRSDLAYVKGIHNLKIGATYQQTFLNENDKLGIVDNGLLPSLPCFAGNVALASPCTDLLPFDLTRAGGLFTFRGHTDVKQLALYLQD